MSEINFDDYVKKPEAASGMASPVNDDSSSSDIEEDANRNLALQVGLGTALGLEPERVPDYIEGFTEAVTPYYEELGIAEALHDYGILGGGEGASALPAWFRLLAGAGVTGLTIFQLRRGERAAFSSSGVGHSDSGADNGQSENSGAFDYATPQ